VTSPTLLNVSYITTIRVLLTKISVFFVAVCLSCFDFGKGGGVVVCFVLFLVLLFSLIHGISFITSREMNANMKL
jgi:hypothetical protein